jgi:cytosine/adenosine deaminase-related metal-dependent hydrolase
MNYVAGRLLTPEGFRNGYLGFDHHTILDVGSGTPPQKPVAHGLIVPFLTNMHTHIGDTFIKKKPIHLPHNVEQLVAPPDGIKHKLLHEATPAEIQQGMTEAVDYMLAHWTSCFCYFREEGLPGITQLRSVLAHKRITSVILSRPATLQYNAEEINSLLENSQGIGLSSIRDWEYSEIQKIARHTKKQHKLFALHCSEVIREDIDCVLDLQPDLLVHMVKATKSDLERVNDAQIPIVVCARSNMFFGLRPNLRLMKTVGNTIFLGTDNAMITSPDILAELCFVKQKFTLFSMEELLLMASYYPRKVLNPDYNILGLNSPPTFIVLSENSYEPVYSSSGWMEV